MEHTKESNLLRAELAEEEGRAVHEAVIAAKASTHDDLTAEGASRAEVDDHEARRILQHRLGVRAEVDDHEARRILQHRLGVATKELGRQLQNVVFENAVAHLGFVLGRGRCGGGVRGSRRLDVRRR